MSLECGECEGIRKAVARLISDLKGRADSIEEDAEAVLADAFSRAILAERERIASNLFNRNGFMTSNSDGSKHFIEITFPSANEMDEFQRAVADLAKFKREAWRYGVKHGFIDNPLKADSTR